MLEWAHMAPGTDAYFFTFTYDPDALPTTPDGHPTLRKKHFLKWLNNRSRTFGKFRYFAVGEYGEKFLRPHYHAGVFSINYGTALGLKEKWEAQAGFADLKLMSRERAAYLCQYTAKKLTKVDDERLAPGVEPEFRTSTRLPPIGAPGLPTLLHPYSLPAGKRILADRGDVERTYRIGDRIYPCDEYLLRKMRTALGIPVTHTGRIDAHPDYWQCHVQQEAECDPKLAQVTQEKLRAKKKLKQTITRTL